MLTARTRIAAVVGHPIGHSLSPTIHNAAFAAAGIDWAYGAFGVREGGGELAVDAMRTLGIAGLSVTTPLKEEVAASVDRLSADSATLGAVNCVRWDGSELVGENTDGPGFVESLKRAQYDIAGRSVVVVGAGPAARSVMLALDRAGAERVGVFNRSRPNAEAAASLGGSTCSVVDATAISHADLVVQATPTGMRGPLENVSAFDFDLLRESQMVVELVYDPIITPLREFCGSRGVRNIDGVGMLVGQAAIAWQHWTGIEAPYDVMSAAARKALAT